MKWLIINERRFSWRNRRCRCTPATPTGAKRSRTSASSVSSRFRPTTSWSSTSASTRAKNPTAAPTATDASSSSATSSSTPASTQVSPGYSFYLFKIFFYNFQSIRMDWKYGPRPVIGSWESCPNVRNGTSTILVEVEALPPLFLPPIEWMSLILFTRFY